MSNEVYEFTITSKINVTPKGDYLPISKLHSILAVAILLAHNNKSRICYCGQISLQSDAASCSFSDNLTHLGVPFILLAMTNYCAVIFLLEVHVFDCLLWKTYQFVARSVKADQTNFPFQSARNVWIKDYCITGRANPISCAVGLR